MRRVLAKHYRPTPGADGPSWLSFIAQCKDSVWSVDLFRYESILLRSHWVMVVMGVFTRRLIGFGVAPAPIDGVGVCRMFNYAITGQALPKHLSTDHDPLFRFYRWLANLRVLDIEEIKSVPYAPVSNSLVERLIGTIRREVLDQKFFWNALDLTRKLEAFRCYYNEQRVHRSLGGTTPAQRAGASAPAPATLDHYGWRQYCYGLFQIPVAARLPIRHPHVPAAPRHNDAPERNLPSSPVIGQNTNSLHRIAHSTMSATPSPYCSISPLRFRRGNGRVVVHMLLAAAIAMSAGWCFADTDTAQLNLVASSGMPVPGGGTFDRFHVEGQPAITPVNDRGQVAFFATLAHARASEGMFLGDANGIQAIALNGFPLPGGGRLASFSEHPVPALNRAGAVAFSASIAEGKASEGVFLSSAHRLRVIALSGSASSGIPGGVFSWFQAPALNDNGEVAFLAGVRRGRDTLEAIYLHRAGTLHKIAAAGDPAPGGGSFSAFGVPALNNKGEVAFAAVIEEGSVTGGVFVISATERRMLVGAGTPEPYGGIFAQFSDRVSINSAGSVLFNAVLKLGPVSNAIFVVGSGKVRPVAGVGQAGSFDAEFSALGPWPGLSDKGTAAFIAAAADSSGTVGLYLTESQQTKRRAVAGDTLPGGSKLASLLLYPAVTSSPRGTLAFAIQGASAGGENFEAILIALPPRE